MGVLALSLVLITLATACVFSRIPENHPRGDYVIVKEGHRVVVVEYAKDDKNTKISIFPQEIDGKLTNFKDKSSENTEDAKEKINEKGSNRSSFTEIVCEADAHAHAAHAHAHARAHAHGKCKKNGRVFDTVSQYFRGGAKKAAKTAHLVKVAEILIEGADRYERALETAEKNHRALVDRLYKLDEEVKNRQAEIERNVSTTKEKIQDSTKKQVVKDSAQRVKDDGGKDLNRFLSWDWGIFANISESTATVAGILSLLSLATAYGMSMWVTFVSRFVLAGALPRQQFAMVQSKINPVYFKAMTCSLGLALLGHVLSGAKRLSSMRQEIVQGFNLVAPLLMTLVNFLYLEPRSSKVMLERMKEEKEEGRGKEPSSQVIDAFTDRAAPSSGKEGLVMEQIGGVIDQVATGIHAGISTTTSA